MDEQNKVISNQISFDDFEKVDIRMGTVISADVPEWSHWVIKLTVDFGEFGQKTIFAGMMKFFKPEDLVNKQFPFIINIKPKKIGSMGDFSEGMMMAADLVEDLEKPDDGRPVLFNLSEKVPNGTKVR